MKVLALNDQELAIIKQAIESFNDISNDMLFENISFNLYPTGDEAPQLTYEAAKTLRNELIQAMDDLMVVRTLLAKVGGSVNEKGFSV